jgi:hypothetical protein
MMMTRNRRLVKSRRQREFEQLAASISRLSPEQQALLWYRLEDEQLLRNPLLQESLEQMYRGEFASAMTVSEEEAAEAKEILQQPGNGNIAG